MALVRYLPIDSTKGAITVIDEAYTGELLPNSVFISDIPEPEYRLGYNPLRYVNLTNNSIYFEYVERPLTDAEKLMQLQESQKTADQKYKELDLSVSTLDDVKAAKIAQLKELCTQSIYDGFASSIGHSFGFNDKDQANFTQQSVLVVLNGLADTDTIQWKTADAGVVDLTIAQFKTIIGEAKDYKLQQQTKYWQLEAQVNAATTNQEVDAVIW